MTTDVRFPRRTFLEGGAIALAAALAACERGAAGSRFVGWDAWWRRQRRTGRVRFANWPYYIDRLRDNSHPSLELFTKRTGIRVDYRRPIRDNARFLERMSADLEEFLPTGYDVIVMTNGPELSTLIDRGWLIPLDHSRLPNFRDNASTIVRDPVWDPGNRFSVAWQSGFTGIAYRPEALEALGRAPGRLQDLFDPALRGRVGMMSDLLDLGSFGLLALGIDPAASTPAQWREAASVLSEQRASGVVRDYFDQSYLTALQRGDVWVSQAWSGDIYQANRLGHPELRFVVPDDGLMFWTDNMLIPRHARHPVDALELMNFVYDPEVAAMIADWVWYVCPVPAARGIVWRELDDPAVAKSPLVFPKADLLGRSVDLGGGRQVLVGSPLRSYPPLPTEDERLAWQRTFAPIVRGA